MNNSRAFRALALLIAGLFLSTLARPVLADDAAPAIKIGVCNVSEVLKQLTEFKDWQDKWSADLKLLDATKLDKTKKVQDLQAAAAILQDPQQQAAKNEEVMRATVEFNVWQEMTKLDLARKQKTEMKSLYEKIQVAVSEVAQKKGMILVIADRHAEISAADFEKADPGQLDAAYLQRSVLYNDAGLDITANVATNLNLNYAKQH